MEQEEQDSVIHRPVAKRVFSVTPASAESSYPATPGLEATSASLLDPNRYVSSPDAPSRTHSVRNLTSSTLYGIYNPSQETTSDSKSSWIAKLEQISKQQRQDADAQDPKETLAFFPAPSGHQDGLLESRLKTVNSKTDRYRAHRGSYLPIAIRTTALFAFGVIYGAFITHLHDNKNLTPVPINTMNKHNWQSSFFWGLAGVGLGSLLPWLDFKLESQTILSRPTSSKSNSTPTSSRPTSSHNHKSGDESDSQQTWTPIIRSIGAFIGISFAIRRLPWASTLQLSLTLALANPVLWYMLDRSTPGFVLSTLVGVLGTVVLLGIDPAILPTPPSTGAKFRGGVPIPSQAASANRSGTESGFGAAFSGGLVSLEGVGVGTWIASVLFCSCICFGSIGRRLAASGSALSGAQSRRSSVI